MRDTAEINSDLHAEDAAHGCLLLLGAPLGNTRDASTRLAEVLSTADVVAAEDTRRLRRLAAELGISIAGQVVSYFEGNERQRTEGLLQRLRQGATVAVISDGGMPAVSDPGFRVVRAALQAGVAVSAVPGPSAVTTALVLSGLPSERFCFEGFLPRKASERAQLLTELAAESRTMVFFESPHRIAASMADLTAAFGPRRPAALCRELTKTYEEVRRGELGELRDGVDREAPRGEITLVVAGAAPNAEVPDAAGLAGQVRALIDEGVDRKDAMSQVAKRFGIPKRVVFDAVVATRDS